MRDDGTQSQGPETQGAPSRRRGVGGPEALGAGSPPGYYPATGEGPRRPLQWAVAEGNRGSGVRTVQKECGQWTGL